MEKKFAELDITTSSFVLNEIEALNYLDYVARQHTEQVLNGEGGTEGMTELLEDICEMKKDIIEHDYEYIKFVECPASASHINIEPMIEESELRYAVEDLAEWVLQNTDGMIPLIYKNKRHQSLLEKYVKEMREE